MNDEKIHSVFYGNWRYGIWADSEDEAIRKFNEEIDQNDIIENMTENGWDITEIFEEDDCE